MEKYSGKKWFLAHSLGNMLVASAIEDYAMNHELFFMLNAAVPLEALRSHAMTSEMKENMTPQDWCEYEDRLRPTHWYELFPDDDGRHTLTWKDRFASVTNIINFYSREEEVLRNGDGLTHGIFSREY